MTNDSTPAVPESERCAYIYRYWGENVCDEPPDAEVHWASNNPTITPHRHAFVAPAASEAPADDLEVSPALERFRKKVEAANAGNYCVSCGRSFGEPTPEAPADDLVKRLVQAMPFAARGSATLDADVYNKYRILFREAADEIERLRLQQKKHVDALRELDLECLQCEIERLRLDLAAMQESLIQRDGTVFDLRREIERLKREPTITRKQFENAVEAISEIDFEAMPPREVLERALAAAGITVQDKDNA